MLAVCDQKQDADLLEKMIRSDDRQVKSGLDALIAAYLTLKGPAGMPLVEDLFLKKKDADYTETYAAIMALRFHGQEEQAVPRARLLEALHYMLDRPQLADLVIADLARWQDWAVMDRLVTLFKNATDETSWVRVPVINYLQACPLPEAKERLAELAKLDPESVKKATTLFPVGPAAASRDKSSAGDSKSGDAGTDAKKKTTVPARTTAAKKIAGAGRWREARAAGRQAGDRGPVGRRFRHCRSARWPPPRRCVCRAPRLRRPRGTCHRWLRTCWLGWCWRAAFWGLLFGAFWLGSKRLDRRAVMIRGQAISPRARDRFLVRMR